MSGTPNTAQTLTPEGKRLADLRTRRAELLAELGPKYELGKWACYGNELAAIQRELEGADPASLLFTAPEGEGAGLREALGEPHCWVVPGRDKATDYGHIDAHCVEEGEMSRPLWPLEAIQSAFAALASPQPAVEGPIAAGVEEIAAALFAHDNPGGPAWVEWLAYTKDKRTLVGSVEEYRSRARALAPLTPPADPKPTVPGNDAGMREACAPFLAEADRIDPPGNAETTDDNVQIWQSGSFDITRSRITYGDLRRLRAALTPQTGSAGEDPKTPDAGVLADKIKLKLDEPSFRALGKELGGNVTEPGYLLAFKVRPTGTDSLIVRLASGRDTIVGETEWTPYPAQPAPVGEDETGVRGGYVLVPREPTEEMVNAGMKAADKKWMAWTGGRSPLDGMWFFVRDAYPAMLAAAPGALAKQPTKAETPAGVGELTERDVEAPIYEAFARYVGDANERATEFRMFATGYHAALSAAPAARPGDGVERAETQEGGR